MTDKKTKKQLEEELTETVIKNEALSKAYDDLLEQAKAVQAQSNNRLVSIRLLENFANTVINASSQLQRDMNELNLVQQPAQDGEPQGRET